VVGRASPSGPLDNIIVRKGRWATRPGEIVIDPNQYGDATIGGTVTVTSAPGQPKLTVVGLALSVTEDQEAWVVPSQLAALRAKGAPVQEQMLYTFTHAATTGQVSADLAELKAALPAGAVTNSVSWLDTEGTSAARTGTAHLATGQAIHMTVGGATVTAKITGQVYAPGPLLGALLTSEQTFTSAHASLPVRLYQALIRPGTGQQKYQAALSRALGPGFTVIVQGVGIHGVGLYGLVDTSLIRLLTILVAVLAGLGVLNSVLMLTRERVHDLGIFKAVGMTPPQAIIMVTCWVIVPAIAAAIIALPAGMALQNAVIHAIAGGQPGSVRSATSIGSLVHVYTPGGLVLLALAGLAIAITGALGPATWAAAARTTTALRAE